MQPKANREQDGCSGPATVRVGLSESQSVPVRSLMAYWVAFKIDGARTYSALARQGSSGLGWAGQIRAGLGEAGRGTAGLGVARRV